MPRSRLRAMYSALAQLQGVILPLAPNIAPSPRTDEPQLGQRYSAFSASAAVTGALAGRVFARKRFERSRRKPAGLRHRFLACFLTSATKSLILTWFSSRFSRI